MTEIPTYRNQSIDLLSKSMDWFLYERGSVIKELIFLKECYVLSKKSKNKIQKAWPGSAHT